eukprot:COSAG06_NODE_25396_length_638_cov_0.736549_1_plen_125_part_10
MGLAAGLGGNFFADSEGGPFFAGSEGSTNAPAGGLLLCALLELFSVGLSAAAAAATLVRGKNSDADLGVSPSPPSFGKTKAPGGAAFTDFGVLAGDGAEGVAVTDLSFGEPSPPSIGKTKAPGGA